MSTKPDTKNIEALLSAVNSSSQHVRNFYVTFLLAGLYIAIIIWSTTDMILLKETPVNLPLLNAKLPINGFYTFAPYFYLLIHFNLLLQLCLLSDKLHGYNAALSKLEDNQSREYYETRLFPFAFSHTLSGKQHTWMLKFLLTIMVWITIIWLPLCILMGLQIGFLAYHSEEVLQWQRWAICMDLFILGLFWPIIRSPNGKWLAWVLSATGLFKLLSWINRRFLSNTFVNPPRFLYASVQRFSTRISGIPMLEGALSVFTLIGIISFSFGIAVLPDSDNEKWMANKVPDTWLSENPLNNYSEQYFRLTQYLFDGFYQKNDLGRKQPQKSIFHRNLKLREKLIIANELKPEDLAHLADNGGEVPEEVLKKIVGLNLKGRDLRYADFRDSLLPKVDFRKINEIPTNLKNANFTRAKAFKARMNQADLEGAILINAQLQGAILKGANLIGAKLMGADLQGADLSLAFLYGANLEPSNLYGKKGRATQLQGSNLYMAFFIGTHLPGAHLQGANLTHAHFYGATLRGAQLQGTNLQYAHLQGANLENANLTLSNITGAEFGQLSKTESGEIYRDFSAHISKPKLLKKIRERLDQATKAPVLTEVEGKDIWGWDEAKDLKVHNDTDGNFISSWGLDKTRYQNSLRDVLIKLSCENKSVVSGIIRFRGGYSMLSKSNFAQCLLLLKDKKDNAGQSVCPSVSEISKKDILILKKVASLNNIKSTFECKI